MTGNQQTLGLLFQSLAPIIRKITLNYSGNLPQMFIEGEVKKNVLIALQSWDPNKAQMNTHIQNQCQKVLREIYKVQAPARLAEESHLKVPAFQHVQANLSEQFGRPPTPLEIAREMQIGVNEVRRLQTGARKNLGAIEGAGSFKMSEKDRQNEVLDLIQYELTTQEQQVLNFSFGLHGSPALSSKDIAARMGLTAPRISQIRSRIHEVLQHHFGGHKIQLP